MSGYSDNPAHVKISFWKPESGKWYMDEMLDMSGEYDAPSPFAAVRNALARTRHGRLAEKRWIITVPEPYHVNGHPIMLNPGRASYEDYEPSSDRARIFLGEVPEDGKWGMVDWALMYHVTVRDPDGWRSEGVDPLTLIDQDTFLRLVAVSTITGEGVANMGNELLEWSARHGR